MYKAPIEILHQNLMDDARISIEGSVLKAVARYDILVDKDELLKALAYDRGQYEKGFADGRRAAMDELVRCKDCDCWCEDMKTGHQEFGNVTAPCEVWSNSEFGYTRYTAPDDFCSYGERKEK